MERTERNLYILVASVLFAIGAAGIITDGPIETIKGLIMLQTTGARLIQDFTMVGVGAALLNAALVAAIGLVLVFFSSVSLSGPTIAAIFTMAGFGLFGKTPLNCLPIIGGVWLAAFIAHKNLGSYSLIALFGTALGPLVTYLMFELNLPLAASIPLGLLTGVAAGFILPAVAGSMLQLHQGYNLYNVGFTCGFIGLFFSSLLKGASSMAPLEIVWNIQPHPTLILLIPILCAGLILAALLTDGFHQVQELFQGFLSLQKLSGRLPTDFVDNSSAGGTLLNMGLLGLASWSYVALVGAPFNGPVLGGILTVIGFGAFGKTLRNSWPIVAGALLATWVFGKEFSAPGPILAALFCTTLAPIAGKFGIVAGLAAGFIHLFMVETTAAWHGGLDLYNNGFAGGLTATLIIAVLQWYNTNRPKEDFDR